MGNRPKSVRSIAAKAALFLLLGAIVNVVVAWGVAIAPQSEPRGFERRLASSQFQTFAWVNTCELSITQSSGMSSINWLGDPPTSVDAATFRKLVPRGSAFADHDPVSDFDLNQCMADVVERLFGWPVLSMKSTTTAVFESADKIMINTTAIGLPASWTKRIGGKAWRTELPTQPLWPGFAINTLFYAAILWLLFAAPFALRRKRRIKRGLCPACAYPVGTSDVCTECGKPVTGRLTGGMGQLL